VMWLPAVGTKVLALRETCGCVAQDVATLPRTAQTAFQSWGLAGAIPRVVVTMSTLVELWVALLIATLVANRCCDVAQSVRG
jgi:hypothetical protein